MIKIKIANWLRSLAERFDPTPVPLPKHVEPVNPFGLLVDAVVQEPPAIDNEIEKVADLLRAGAIHRLHKNALEIFIAEDSIRTEEDYWKLSNWRRGQLLDSAIKSELVADDNAEN